MTITNGARTTLRRLGSIALPLALAGTACHGAIGGHGTGTITGSGGMGGNDGPTKVDPGLSHRNTAPLAALGVARSRHPEARVQGTNGPWSSSVEVATVDGSAPRTPHPPRLPGRHPAACRPAADA